MMFISGKNVRRVAVPAQKFEIADIVSYIHVDMIRRFYVLETDYEKGGYILDLTLQNGPQLFWVTARTFNNLVERNVIQPS